MKHVRVRAALTVGAATAAALLLGGCSLAGGGDGPTATEPSTSPTESGGTGEPGGTVVLATHESFTLPKKLVRAFEEETGYTLEVRAAGDAGTLATKLSLTADNPIADAAFGIDNTFASRPLGEGAFAEVSTTATPPDEYVLAEGGDRLVPIDSASVCVNVDTDWFDAEGLEPPQTLDDLTDPAYADLMVTPGASTSSPGMAFFLATVAAYGDDWQDYWTDLLANGAKVVDGWEDAYYGDFTAGSEQGTRPIVVSYDSSPAFTVADGRTTTAALLDTCFRQVEYAGVLAGADNPEGAAALVDWMLTDEVQSALPESMYVFPVMPGATVPDDWAEFAPQPTDPFEVSPEEIAANREQWLTEWTDVISR
ncbi:thiamine ABC transporter substrate-binding protein [Nocardioides ganghwensis]|jgi:thiamine transport system substrate-binding protein|uniref:Thiamine ABC transporter substrate-binding protein n=1 Tax=Nocardioides ganghwensis TaxID=252230 RepID=A0A4Q2SFJ4_9ACTN|nr:thiamine ABC transporter substrate-binding protein [Nocardioides ganghwensis]MBD3945466.1 thiamine ABC transporter substrate-binding protein [Nocardioides ganghwensis]RYC02306.1 thiamine ABC transporter substrate-binding protein [Nocardioides ganghwensis]